MSEIALSDGKRATIPLCAGDPQDRVGKVAKRVNVLDSLWVRASCGPFGTEDTHSNTLICDDRGLQ